MRTLSFLLLFLSFFYTSVLIADEFEDEFSSDTKEVYDPLYRYNSFMTGVNDKIIMKILKPISKGYSYIAPKPARKSIENFFTNLMFPIRFINNFLQLKFKNSFEEANRFVLNSTFGIGGLFDLASKNSLPLHDEDFGQTLGYYGIGSGFPIVWPLLGESNLRDSAGLFVDSFANPLNYLEDRGEFFTAKALRIVNYTSLHVKEYEELKKDAIELYPFIRDVYEQRREKLIKE